MTAEGGNAAPMTEVISDWAMLEIERNTYEGDAAVVDEVQHTNACERLRDKVRELVQHGAFGPERGQRGHG